ncbi:MAG: Brp/Blh family beta-carotene 15,15'-dioxygenase [Pseudomonadota bacterium]
MTPASFSTRTFDWPLTTLIIGSLIAMAGAALFGTGLTWQLVLLIPLVALLGLPHGCLDLAIAKELRPLPSIAAIAIFVIAYLAMSGAVIALWLAAPGPALAAFLLYSAVHFGGDWRDELPRGAFALPGLAIVAIPAVLYQAQTAQILAYLAPQAWAATITQVMTVIAVIAAPISIILLAISDHGQKRLPGFACLMILGLLAPPLIYFIVYFCLSHSPQHLREAREALKLSWKQVLNLATPIWLATITGALAAWLLIPGPIEAAALQTIFIGLAALTVPHMLLVEALWLSKDKQFGKPPSPAMNRAVT